MTVPTPAAKVSEPQSSTTTRLTGPLRWVMAVIQSTRPRQWPKNLLVFAAPLAGHTLGRPGGFWYALAPAISVAVCLVLVALGTGFVIGEPMLTLVIAAYLIISFLYSAGLKHTPVIELASVASGFVLRVVGGAVATHVPPSGWFLLVCSLGALMVAIAKRYTELTVLGADAAKHRPAMRGYSAIALRTGQRAVSAVMVVCYVFWASSEPAVGSRTWHLISSIALLGALVRFDRLTARATSKPVEDLIARDPVMVGCEVAWLILFALGL